MYSEFFIASSWKRLMARSIDGLVQLILLAPAMAVLLYHYVRYDEMYFSYKWVFFSIVVVCLYRILFYKFMGATVGKLIMGLRLVSVDDFSGDLRWLQVIIRVLAEFLSLFFSWAFYMLMFFRYDRTHLADWLAHTRVVQAQPRLSRPSVRPVFGFLAFLYFLTSGVSGFFQNMQKIRFEKDRVIIDAFPNSFRHELKENDDDGEIEI